MAETSVSCTFDKDAVWKKVRGRKVVVLDMNCWINMADDKFPLATRVKDVLRKLVSDGQVICPLSFGLICELLKQLPDSRLRVGRLMDELSLNVSYAPKEEIFAWEVERAVRRMADAGPFDLSLSGIYAPFLGHITAAYQLRFPSSFPAQHVGDGTKKLSEAFERLTLTDVLLRAGRRKDDVFDGVRSFQPPAYAEEAKRVWAITKGDKQKALRIEAVATWRLHIVPAIKRLPLNVLAKFREYVEDAPKDKTWGFLGELLKSLPAIHNHVELMAAHTQDPSRKDKDNDFYDLEIMPVPLAYASAFVAQDKGIRDVLRNRTTILTRSTCRYCFDLAEFEEWLKTEVSR